MERSISMTSKKYLYKTSDKTEVTSLQYIEGITKYPLIIYTLCYLLKNDGGNLNEITYHKSKQGFLLYIFKLIYLK